MKRVKELLPPTERVALEADLAALARHREQRDRHEDCHHSREDNTNCEDDADFLRLRGEPG